jgi:FkbM family methyltransferase
MLPFIVSTLPLYLVYDLFSKRIIDSVAIWTKKLPIPVVWFTPTSRIIPCPFLDFSTLAIINEVYILEIYRKLPQYTPRDWVVVDAGANVGLFSLYAIDHGSKSVIALEPFSRNYRRLTITLRANNAIVAPLFCALSSQNGHLEFVQSKDSATSHIAFGSESVSEKTIKVSGISLRHLLKEFNLSHVDLLKLDIEGAEYSIVSSSEDLLKAGCVKRIVGELHGNEKDFDAFVHHLTLLGFKTEYLVKSPPVAFIHAKHFSVASV